MVEVSQIEKDIWGVSPIPPHQTLTAVKNGGIVVGAYEDSRLIGFSYGFAGFTNQKISLCSHMLGIAEDYRSSGIGHQLKLAQKEQALNIGYDLMTWTFDPLQTRNAYLNMTKLHGVCDTYIQDCYGKMEDGINGGLPSDRFQVAWWINSGYVNQHVKNQIENAEVVETWLMDEVGFPHINQTFDKTATYDGNAYLVPVPSDIGAIKEHDLQAALAWRQQTRAIFQTLFAQGYIAIELEKTPSQAVYHYVVVKKSTLDIPQ